MISPGPLLLGAALVGILHMSAPDHWATLIILGRVSDWSRARLLGVGAMTAVGHAAFSILLGFAIVAIGLLFTQQVSLYVTEGTGLIMVMGGLAYGVRELRGPRTEDYEEEVQGKLSTGDGTVKKRFGYFAILGAALSPDLSILPVFLLAVPLGLSFALGTAIVFGLATVGSLLLFLFLGSAGLARALERIPPKYNDALVGFVIAVVGAYVIIVG